MPIRGTATTGSITYDHNPAGPEMSLYVEVDDAKIRQDHPGFDGMEKVFALIPQQDGEWKRFDMKYGFTAGSALGQNVDFHGLSFDSPFLSWDQVNAVRGLGVAFGMETNVGTIWLQGYQQNLKLADHA